MLLSYTNASFISLMSSAPCHSYSASSNFSPTLPLLSAIHLCFFVFSPPTPSWEVRDVVLHVPGSPAALGVCLSCYQAAVYDGQGLHGSLCFTWTVLVSAGGVVGPVSQFPLQQLLQELSYEADMRKSINTWSLKCWQHLFTLFTVAELKDLQMSMRY